MLGRRVKKPAQGYFFLIGGRINKNKAINSAMKRITENELNIELTTTPRLVGVFEHFYDDSIYESVSTHYVNLAYEYEAKEVLNLPAEHHNEYKWFAVN